MSCPTELARLYARVDAIERQISGLCRQVRRARALAEEAPRVPYRNENDRFRAEARALEQKVCLLTMERNATRFTMARLRRRRRERWAGLVVTGFVASAAIALLLLLPRPYAYRPPRGIVLIDPNHI